MPTRIRNRSSTTWWRTIAGRSPWAISRGGWISRRASCSGIFASSSAWRWATPSSPAASHRLPPEASCRHKKWPRTEARGHVLEASRGSDGDDACHHHPRIRPGNRSGQGTALGASTLERASHPACRVARTPSPAMGAFRGAAAPEHSDLGCGRVGIAPVEPFQHRLTGGSLVAAAMDKPLEEQAVSLVDHLGPQTRPLVGRKMGDARRRQLRRRDQLL
jgi:hypothetical protein